MTLQQEVDALRSRIAKAESERDAWRAAGPQEKYFEAYFMVEALESQLDRRLRDHAIAVEPEHTLTSTGDSA
jgi:hypothetical protein